MSDNTAKVVRLYPADTDRQALIPFGADMATKEGAMSIEAVRHQLEMELIARKVEYAQDELLAMGKHEMIAVTNFLTFAVAHKDSLKGNPEVFHYMLQWFEQTTPSLAQQVKTIREAGYRQIGRVVEKTVDVAPVIRNHIPPEPPRKKGLIIRIVEALFGT